MQEAPDFTGARWFKANGSGDGGCVEVAITPVAVGVRDSKTENSPVLAFSRSAWSEFIESIKAGAFAV